MIEKKIVYLPVKAKDINNHQNITLVNIRSEDIFCSEQELFTFTQEQLNEYTQNVIKESLEIASEKAIIYEEDWGVPEWSANYNPETLVDKQSITNSFNEIYEKLKV